MNETNLKPVTLRIDELWRSEQKEVDHSEQY